MVAPGELPGLGFDPEHQPSTESEQPADILSGILGEPSQQGEGYPQQNTSQEARSVEAYQFLQNKEIPSRDRGQEANYNQYLADQSEGQKERPTYNTTFIEAQTPPVAQVPQTNERAVLPDYNRHIAGGRGMAEFRFPNSDTPASPEDRSSIDNFLEWLDMEGGDPQAGSYLTNLEQVGDFDWNQLDPEQSAALLAWENLPYKTLDTFQRYPRRDWRRDPLTFEALGQNEQAEAMRRDMAERMASDKVVEGMSMMTDIARSLGNPLSEADRNTFLNMLMTSRTRDGQPTPQFEAYLRRAFTNGPRTPDFAQSQRDYLQYIFLKNNYDYSSTVDTEPVPDLIGSPAPVIEAAVNYVARELAYKPSESIPVVDLLDSDGRILPDQVSVFIQRIAPKIGVIPLGRLVNCIGVGAKTEAGQQDTPQGMKLFREAMHQFEVVQRQQLLVEGRARWQELVARAKQRWQQESNNKLDEPPQE